MRKMNIGIFAHIDAGKTSLTERLLALSGEVRKAGSVDGKTAATDFLPVERRRGISVRDASVTLHFEDCEIHIIDTPGHADFLEETELALSAVDGCVLVVSCADGVQAQTELLYAAMQKRNLPVFFFLNKCDRTDVDPQNVIRSIKSLSKRDVLELDGNYFEDAVALLETESLLDAYLAGNLKGETLDAALSEKIMQGGISPLLCGSARTGAGCQALLSALVRFLRPAPEEGAFSAFVYQVTHHKTYGKTAHVRIFSGEIRVREEIFNPRTQSRMKATQLKYVQGEKYADTDVLSSLDTGAIVGLSDVRAGDVLGEVPIPLAPQLATPYLRVRVIPKREEELPALKAALEQLCCELPSLALEWVKEKRELAVSASGKVQTEILQELLLERYGICADMGAPSVIYRETPTMSAFGFEAYTMPKPCWAVVKLFIEPMPRGSGLIYESVCSEKKIAYRYQNHIAASVPETLRQGLKGWQVTDLKVTLVDGENHPQHTHPLDFFVATPMAVMNGLKNCGTTLLEPILLIKIHARETSLGKVIGELSPRRAVYEAPTLSDGSFTLEAKIPAAESFGLKERILSVTEGRGQYDSRLYGYEPCPEGMGAVRERDGIDPLDRAKWILHARGAL